MTDAPNNGGPAFPHPGLADPTFHARGDVSGMTLRDWFAGQALPGLIAGYATAYGTPTHHRAEMVAEAYGFADAMLAAREAAE